MKILAAALCSAALCGCTALAPSATPPPAVYTLDSVAGAAPRALRPAALVTGATGLTLVVSPPHAASGFDSRRIIYVREAHKLEYFAHSDWADSPARMLAPLVAAAIERSGVFRAVALTPSAAAADLRLDTEVVRLQHEFGQQPSRVRFTLRATLVEVAARRVLASRELDAVVPAASEDPYGGVIAANRAVAAVLEELSAFCVTAIGPTRAPATPSAGM